MTRELGARLGCGRRVRAGGVARELGEAMGLGQGVTASRGCGQGGRQAGQGRVRRERLAAGGVAGKLGAGPESEEASTGTLRVVRQGLREAAIPARLSAASPAL